MKVYRQMATQGLHLAMLDGDMQHKQMPLHSPNDGSMGKQNIIIRELLEIHQLIMVYHYLPH
jgi:hypothetical protein